MFTNNYLNLKTNKAAHRFIAWCLIALMMFGLVPMSSLTVEAAEGDSGVTRNISDVIAEKGYCELTLTEKGSALGPVIKSKNTLSYSQGTSAHVAEYTIGGVNGVGFCLDHTKSSGSTMHVKVNANNSLEPLTKNVFYMGYSDNGRNASGNYVTGLIDAANGLTVPAGKGKIMDDSLVSTFNSMSADAKDEAWRKATQLAVWMSTKAGGKANMVIEGQMTYQGGSVRAVDTSDPSTYVDIIKNEYGNNSGSAEKVTLGLAKVLYLMAATGTDQGWHIADREPKMETFPLEKNILTGRNFYNEATGLVDFTNAGTVPGEGNIARAFDDLGGTKGIIKQTVAGKECYVIYYGSFSQTQPLGNMTASISDSSKNVPSGTFLSGLSTEDCTELGIDTSYAHSDKTGTDIAWPANSAVTNIAGSDGFTDSAFGITAMPVTGHYDADTHINFPMYYKLCIPVDSVSPSDTTKVAIQIVGSTTSATSYECYQAENENSSMQPFLLGDTVTSVNSNGDVVWAGAETPPPVEERPGGGGSSGGGGGGTESQKGIITKVDTNGSAVAGAEFHFEGIGANTGRGDFKSDGMGVVNIQWTNPDGADYLSPGSYQVTETNAPTGYNLDSNGSKTIELYADGTCSGPLRFVNSPRPTIILHKQDDSGNTLDGVYFNMYKDGALVGEVGPTVNGEIEVGAPDGLENGYYEFEEKEAPAGFIKSTERKGINVDFDNQTYTLAARSLTFTNSEYPTIHILKKNDAGKGLGGAVFEVKIDETSLGEFSTIEDGSLNIGYDTLKNFLDQNKGSWTVSVREVKAPADYLLDDDNWHSVELKLGQDPAPFVFTDSKYPRIEIVKLENGTTTGLPGAVFEVAIDGTSIGTDFTSGADGKIVIDYEHYSRFLGDGVNQADKVWDVAVREITAPDGYLIDNDDWQHAQLKLGQTLAPFTFTDSKYPDIKIIKLDKETGDPLPNTSFRIQIDGTSFIAEKATNEKGEIVITYAEFGHFLTEAGDKDRDSWTITVTELEPTQFYNKDKQQTSGDYTQTQQLKHGQALSVFEFKDTHYRDIKVFKRDSETNWLLKGATFRLHCVAAENKDAGNITDRELTTDEKGYVIFENIPNGTYELTEIAAPFGYDNNSEKKTVIVTSDNDRVIEFEFKNAPKSGLLIRKIDSVTKQPLANVEFRITPLAPLDSPSWTAVTDDNGLIVKENLAAGTYRIEEITTVDGYVLNDKAQLIEIKNQHDAYTVTFENNQKNMLNILKLDAITGLPLPGAIFEVSTAGGTHVANVTTGAFGYASLPNLKPGSYVVKEVKAPEGHIIDPTIKTFEITEDDSGQVITLVFDNSPYTDLYIRKYDAFTNIGLEGAHFKVWKDDTLIADDVTSDEGGFIHIGKQTAGMFQIQEIRAPKGYTLDETVHTIYLKDGETGTIEIPNNKPGGLAIHKTDVKTGESLAGTTFELRTIEGTLIGSKVTGKDGYVRWEQLEPGWYVVTETGAPEGYIVSHKSMNVEVKEFESTEIEWVDDQNASLTIVKRDKDSEVPLKGAIFEIRSMSGDVVERVTTGANGVATTGLLEASWYRIVEVKAPDGYILNEEEQMVEVKLNTPASVDFFNVKQKGITIHKVDALTNDPLAGATFDVRTAADKLIESYTTDASGVITTKALDPGVYTIVETKAPDGYVLNEEKVTVEVVEGEASVVTVKNYPKTIIQIYKTDSVSGEPLQGAEFSIAKYNGATVGLVTTDKTGWANSLVLEPGEYVVTETKAPAGYTLDKTEHKVTVIEGENSILRLTNAPETVLNIVKKDITTHEPLAGAVFELRYDTGHGDCTFVGTYTTDTRGIATTEPLTPGFYMIKEITAPDGYAVPAENEWRYCVKAGEHNELVVEDQQLATLTVRKIDSKTGKPIGGAVFKLENADRKDLVGTLETDANGEAIFTNLTEGFYIVTETQAPTGYQVSNCPQTIHVQYGKNNYCDFKDDENGSLVIILQDKNTGEYLMGGHFTVTNESNQLIVFDGSTDTTGTIVVGNLPAGWYTVTQTFVPDKYTMVDVTQKVEILVGQQQTVYFKDVTAGLVIEKIDAQHPAILLEGARFQVVSNTDNTVIGEYVTGKDGLALVDGLEPGLYTVKELAAPLGFALDAEPQIVHIKEGKTAHATFADTALSSITITVTDENTNKPIPGAVVEVWQQNGVLVNTYTADMTGVIQTDKIPAGKYVLKVVSVPDGFTVGTSEATVTLENGIETTYNFKLAAKGMMKIMSVNNAETAIAGMRVVVTTMDGSKVGEYTTGADGSVIVNDLQPGWYVVKEIAAPNGYTVSANAEQNVEIKAGGDTVVTFRHAQIYGLQIVTSCQQSGAKVAGAVYEIRTLEGTFIGTYTSNDAGLVFVELNPGWYTVRPVSAPSGYMIPDSAPRNVEVKADGLTTTEFVLQQASSIRVKVVDGSNGKGIYGVRLQLKNAGNSIQEFYSNNEGYVTIDQSILNGNYTLEMISAPDGYIVDTVPKSISALLGQTTEITWTVYNNAGQIQVVVTSSDNNATLNKPAGSALQGAVFEIMNADTYQVVGKMISDNSGVAASSGLPIGRYIVSQVGAPAYYAVSDKKIEVRIKINNDVVRTEITNASVNLGSDIQVKANKTIKAGSNMRVDIPVVKNGSDVTLDNFYVHIKVPTDAARISTFNTGAWNKPVFYKVSYRTNMNDYRVLADNLSSMDAHEYGVSTQALGLQSGEYVTDIRMEFGTVPAGFSLTKKVCYLEYVLSTVTNGHKLISRVEMGGQYNTVNVSTTHIDNNFPYSTSGSAVIGAGGNAGAYGGSGSAAISGNSGQWTTSNHQTTTTVTNGSGTLPKMGY